MTITARKAHTQLAAARTIIDDLMVRLPATIGHVYATAGAKPDHAPDGEHVRRKGWLSDPTGTAACNVADRLEDTLGSVPDHLATLALALNLLVGTVNDHGPVVAVEKRRCNGGRSVDEWSDPNCHAIADYTIRADGSYGYRGDGLCVACRSRKRRYDAKMVAA